VQKYQTYLVGIEVIKSTRAKKWVAETLSKRIEPIQELIPTVAKSDLFGYIFEPRSRNWEDLDAFNMWGF
jgi:hypothetical protein